MLEGRISPSYMRVRDWLVDYIVGQKLTPGDRIPSERVLADSLGLSRPTIAKAISQLIESGVLARHEGRSGTYVGGSIPRKSLVRTRTVGMVMPCIRLGDAGNVDADMSLSRYTDCFIRENVSAQIMYGVLSVLKEAGCRLVVHHNNSPEEEADILTHLADEHLDGAVVLPELFPANMDVYTSMPTSGPPVVFVDRYIPNSNVDWVVTDNFAGAKEAVSSLIAKGHRRIAFFTDFSDISSVNEREAGYRTALTEAGIPVDEQIICGPNNMRQGRWSFEYALHYCVNQAEPVTAVFGITDDVVWATLQAAKKLGLLVPDHLEIAGFFDAPVPVGIDTPFIRVVQSKFAIGETAARLLLDRITGEAPDGPRHAMIPATLMLGSAE